MQTLVEVRMLKKEEAGRGKRVPSGVRAPDRFISVKEVANFEEWTRKRRKIAPGHRVDLNDMEGMEIIPNLFNNIGWVPLFTANELFYPEMIYEFYANLHKGRNEFWFYGHRAYASHSIIIHQAFAIWLLPYDDISIFCTQLGWSW
ncbi:hypothetical protein M9H77_30391 [Catharanthus roseus]|uniref:Uncharacterized protein n=1 Tax=Catharanthus roseus TaxID=4058 RepID=A0ACB9ZZ61_CATRO|nr:hypothetical protein M9H77_30391 [Catharanthus roseus]